MTEYTPTIQSVRDGYVWLSAEDNPVARDLAGEDFDRFLACVRRDAYDEAQEWENEVAAALPERYDGEEDQREITLRAVKEMAAREAWVDDRISREPMRHPHAEAHFPELEAEFDRFLARVRRDAAREALDGLAEHIDWTASQFLGVRVGSQKAQDVRDYRDEHYPEETDR